MVSLSPKIKTKIKTKNKITNNKIAQDLSKFKASSIIKSEKIASSPDIFANPASPAPLVAPALSKIDDFALVAQAQASLVGFDEINKLIKKLTLSFSMQKSESSFFIKTGIFEGARFKINCEHKNLHLNIFNLGANAHQVLSLNQDYLRLRLRRKEINLASIMLNT